MASRSRPNAAQHSPYTKHVLDHLPDDVRKLVAIKNTLLTMNDVLVSDIERVTRKIEELGGET